MKKCNHGSRRKSTRPALNVLDSPSNQAQFDLCRGCVFPRQWEPCGSVREKVVLSGQGTCGDLLHTLARNCLLPSLLKCGTIIFIVVVSRIRPSSAVHLVLDSRAVPTSDESTSVVSANPTMLLLGLCEGAVKHGDGFKRLGGADGWGGGGGGGEMGASSPYPL